MLHATYMQTPPPFLFRSAEIKMRFLRNHFFYRAILISVKCFGRLAVLRVAILNTLCPPNIYQCLKNFIPRPFLDSTIRFENTYIFITYSRLKRFAKKISLFLFIWMTNSSVVHIHRNQASGNFWGSPNKTDSIV